MSFLRLIEPLIRIFIFLFFLGGILTTLSMLFIGLYEIFIGALNKLNSMFSGKIFEEKTIKEILNGIEIIFLGLISFITNLSVSRVILDYFDNQETPENASTSEQNLIRLRNFLDLKPIIKAKSLLIGFIITYLALSAISHIIEEPQNYHKIIFEILLIVALSIYYKFSHATDDN